MGKRDEKVGRREGEKGPPKHLAWDPRGLNPALKITTQQQWHRRRADKLSAAARRSTKVGGDGGGGANKLSAAAPTNYRRQRRADQQKSAAAPTNCRRRLRGAAGARLLLEPLDIGYARRKKEKGQRSTRGWRLWLEK